MTLEWYGIHTIIMLKGYRTIQALKDMEVHVPAPNTDAANRDALEDLVLIVEALGLLDRGLSLFLQSTMKSKGVRP